MRLGLLFLLALFPKIGRAEPSFGQDSEKLKVEITDHYNETDIVTLRITNAGSEPYTLTAWDDGPPARLGQPHFWFIFRHPNPNINWFYEDARKGSWDKASYQITIEPGDKRDCAYFLVGFRKHIKYWFYDPQNGLRFKIENGMESDELLNQ